MPALRRRALGPPVRPSGRRIVACLVGAVAVMFLAHAACAANPTAAANQVESSTPAARVPGVVIDYSPAASGLYIGSPGLAVWTNGDYLASHDLFGPKSGEHQRATSLVFRSSDRGVTWRKVATINGAFWSSLFVHRGAAYLMGTDKHHGHIVIRRSTDAGSTWTDPRDVTGGLLTSAGEYHTAPMPVVEHNGRLWRAFEDAGGGTKWGERYRAMMMSIPAGTDLLAATNWVFSNWLTSERSWNGGDMAAWLEGNAVVAPDGTMLNILRVDTAKLPELAAMVRVSADGTQVTFDPETGFVPFNGGAKKFTIRYDPPSERYWSLATVTDTNVVKKARPGSIRNTLALTSSKDLKQWTVHRVLLHHPDTARHGFQYVDWLFDGQDIMAACRTAFDDADGGARNYHDANYLTFHRVRNFRSAHVEAARGQDLPASAEERPPGN